MFGIVFKGRYKRRISSPHSGKIWLDVAIKTVKPYSECGYLTSILNEVKVLAYLGPHPNIVQLMGACTNNLALGTDKWMTWLFVGNLKVNILFYLQFNYTVCRGSVHCFRTVFKRVFKKLLGLNQGIASKAKNDVKTRSHSSGLFRVEWKNWQAQVTLCNT